MSDGSFIWLVLFGQMFSWMLETREREATIAYESKAHHVQERLISTAASHEHSRRAIVDFVDDYRAGRLGRKAAAVIAFDPAKFDAGSEEAPAVQYVWRRKVDDETGKKQLLKVAICPNCGEPLAKGLIEVSGDKTVETVYCPNNCDLRPYAF